MVARDALILRRASALLPGSAGWIYFRERDGTFGPVGNEGHGRLGTRWDDWPLPRTNEAIGPLLAYRLEGRDPLAGRFVNTSATFGSARDDLHRYRELICAAAGADNHLRVVLQAALFSRALPAMLAGAPRRSAILGVELARALGRSRR